MNDVTPGTYLDALWSAREASAADPYTLVPAPSQFATDSWEQVTAAFLARLDQIPHPLPRRRTLTIADTIRRHVAAAFDRHITKARRLMPLPRRTTGHVPALPTYPSMRCERCGADAQSLCAPGSGGPWLCTSCDAGCPVHTAVASHDPAADHDCAAPDHDGMDHLAAHLDTPEETP